MSHLLCPGQKTLVGWFLKFQRRCSPTLPQYFAPFLLLQRLLESLIPSDGSEDLSSMIDPSALVSLGALVPVAERDPFLTSATPSPEAVTTVLESS